MWFKNIKNKKAFTLIEFIIVMAIIGILVLLASPKFLDYVNKAKLTQIINDSKVAENYTTTHKAMYDTLPKGNFINEDELTELIKNKTLYFEGGVIKDLNDFDKDELYLLDKDNLVKEINTKLKGDFIYTDKGIIYIDNANSSSSIEDPVDQTDLIKEIEDQIGKLAVTDNKDEGNELMNSIPKDIDKIINKGEKDKLTKDYEEALEEFLSKFIGPVKQVSLGGNHSAAITEDGDLYTWGWGSSGRLGHGDTNDKKNPTKVATISNIKQVALGEYHSAAITENGDLYTWGLGKDGQLGHGDEKSQLKPKKVDSLSNVKQVALGWDYSAAITGNGELYTWGNNDGGHLGHGDKEHQLEPKKIKSLSKVKIKQVALGRYHSAAITENGDLYTWGRGTKGMLGHGDIRSQLEPKKVDSLSNVKIKQISLGGSHSAVITEDGDLYTWGNGEYGRLGHGDMNDKKNPTKVATISNIKQVALSEYHSAAITEDGDLYTWGNGEDGRLGHGDKEPQLEPKKVESLSKIKVKQVTLGWDYSVAITKNGDVYTWGHGWYGKLGHGDEKPQLKPKKVEFFEKLRKY